MATQAEEALASPTYNPSREPDVLALYRLMQASEPSETLVDQYREVVTSMSTENPYDGVLINPRGCEIDQANSDIDDIIEDIKDNPNVDDTIKDGLEEIQDQLDQYKEHTDRLIANFPTISSVVQGEIANNTSGGSDSSSPAGNPCVGFADIMGSILDSGQQIMNDILAAIANVKDNLQGAQDLIENAITQLQAKIAAAMTQVQDEVTKLATAMLKQSKMNLAQLMKYQNQDPCLKQILSGVLTSTAQNIIEGKS